MLRLIRLLAAMLGILVARFETLRGNSTHRSIRYDSNDGIDPCASESAGTHECA
jgi:hypothetical protein